MNACEQLYIRKRFAAANFSAQIHQNDSYVIHSPQQKPQSRLNLGRFAPQQGNYSLPRQTLAPPPSPGEIECPVRDNTRYVKVSYAPPYVHSAQLPY
jgi:hypothetical protein